MDAEEAKALRDSETDFSVIRSQKPAILVVEDDEFVAEDYGDMLVALGFQVYYAPSAAKALRLAKHFKQFVAAVLDIRIPSFHPFSSQDTKAGTRTGLLIVEEFINDLPDTMLVALTNSEGGSCLH